MCGFAGILAGAGERISPGLLKDMADLQRHRGPNGEGFLRLRTADGAWRTDRTEDAPADFDLGFAARRLAVLDTSDAGDQPMRNADGTVWIAFNGEIYGHEALRHELEAEGRRFCSHTDTEVVLALYESRGLDAVAGLNGMFAFALWDQRRRRLLLARDRLGIKPLYYARAGKALLFASEIKSLLCHPRIRREVDPVAFAEHFTFQYCLDERTLFQGIRQLEPGTMLVVEDGREAHHTYWQFAFQTDAAAPVHHVERLRETLSTAVGRQLRSDVPVGTFLSGGMDTGAISALARAKLGRMHSFTCGFDTADMSGDESYFDERPEARELAKELSTEHHEIEVGPADMPRLIREVAWHLEEPCVGISYQNYAMAEAVGQHAVVVMSGAGGDELFAGYPWRYGRLAAADSGQDTDALYYDIRARLLDDAGRAAVFSDRLLNSLNGFSPRDSYRQVMAGCDDDDPLHRALYFDAKGFLRGLLLVEDKLTMAHSVESRVPLLDNDMIDCALSMPSQLKFAGGRSKVALRQAMAGLLPERHINRRKQGFTPPDATWFRGPSRAYIEAILTAECFLDRGYFNPEGVRGILEAHFQGRADHRFLIWSMMLFEWMHRLFLDPATPAAVNPHSATGGRQPWNR